MRALLRYLLTPLLVLLALFSLVNSCDRRLDPDIGAFTDTSPVGIPEAENAYFAMVGHNVAPGRDPHDEGIAAIAGVEEKFLEDHGVVDQEREVLFGPPGLIVSDRDGLLEKQCVFDCLEVAQGMMPEVRALLDENSVLVDRYRDLYGYEYFSETTTMPFSAERLSSLRESQKTVLLGTALLAREGEIEAALSALEEDIRFWRMVLGGTRRLVNKMVATAALYRNLRLLSEITANSETGGDLAGGMAAVTAPLTERERDLSPAIRGECADTLRRLEISLEGQFGMDPRKIKKNATLNEVFRQFRRETALYSLPADEWLVQWKLRRQEREDGGISFFALPHYFYNPVGKTLARIAVPDFLSFAGKVHNIDGYLSAVSIQLDMKLQSVAPADIPAFLEGACPPHCDPYTLRPFTWDEGEGTVSFTDPVSGKPRSLEVR